MHIVTLCFIHYLNSTSQFLTQALIRRAECTKTVPRIVFLDANALLMPFQFRMNLEMELRRLLGETDVAIPTPVLTELEVLASKDRDAQAALRLARRYREIEASGSADEALLDLALAHHGVVVTNDQPLLNRLRAQGIPRIFLRSRSHLVAEGL